MTTTAPCRGAPDCSTVPTCCAAHEREWALDHRYAQARVAVLARDGYTCTDCGAPDGEAPLHVHHRHALPDPALYDTASCYHHRADLVTLCAPCHRAEHFLQRVLARGRVVQLALDVAA